MNWKADYKDTYGNNTRAAERLSELAKSTEALQIELPDVGTLAARLGELLKSKNLTWWKNRADVLQLLADDLGVEAEVLLGGPIDSRGWPFPEFPTLKPLTATEEPCMLGEQGWLLHSVQRLLRRGASGWLVAPAGSGKSLVRRYLQERLEHELAVVDADVLEQAVSQGATKPLLVELGALSPKSDPKALRALASRSAPTIVLAAFPPPGSSAHAPMMGANVRRAPRSFTHASLPGWEIREELPPAGWPHRLATWIDARLSTQAGDTKLERAALMAWLDRNDPEERLVATPSDLLALASHLHTHGELAPVHDMASSWLERVVHLPVGVSDETARWARRAGKSTVEALAKTWALSHEGLRERLPLTEWTKLLPSGGAPPEQTDGGQVVAAYLRELGLLRSADDGQVELHPRWVARGAQIGAVREALEEDELSASSWGRLAADPLRRAILDRALDGLSLVGLHAVVRQLAALEAVDELGAAGAVEATFAAMARRARADGFKLDGRRLASWQAVMRMQQGLLAGDAAVPGWELPLLQPDYEAWIANAWTLSLRVRASEEKLPKHLAPALPGWFERLPPDFMTGRHFPSIYAKGQRGGVSRAAEHIASLGVEVLARVTTEPTEVPRLLLPAYIELAPSKGWQVSIEQLSSLGDTWEQRYLAERLRRAPSTEVAKQLWDLIAGIEPDLGRGLGRLLQSHRELVICLLEQLTPERFEALLEGKPFKPSAPTFATLPSSLRPFALRYWLESNPSAVEAHELLAAVTQDEADELIDVVVDCDLNILSAVAHRTWMLSRERAREALEKQLGDLERARMWFGTAPLDQTPSLVSLAYGIAERPSWLVSWARARLPHAGEHAEKLFEMFRSGRSAASGASAGSKR